MPLRSPAQYQGQQQSPCTTTNGEPMPKTRPKQVLAVGFGCHSGNQFFWCTPKEFKKKSGRESFFGREGGTGIGRVDPAGSNCSQMLFSSRGALVSGTMSQFVFPFGTQYNVQKNILEPEYRPHSPSGRSHQAPDQKQCQPVWWKHDERAGCLIVGADSYRYRGLNFL